MGWWILGILIVFVSMTYPWTRTPYGRLDYRVALSLRLLTFNINIKPNPATKTKILMPLNLVYPLSALLPKEKEAQVEDTRIPGSADSILIHTYWPEAKESLKSPAPLIVFFHGGGFVTGSVPIYDAEARSIARATNCIVISVEYRLAPTFPYPAAVEDCYTALCWAKENAERLGADPSRLIVAGDSAGGNLATVTALKAKNEGGPHIVAQILFYPVTDMTGKHYPSYDNFVDGYGLTRKFFEQFEQAYLPNEADRSDPYASPICADNLGDMPPALIITAGFDPLTDAALAYGKKLEDAGVAVTYQNYPSTIHGFMSIRLFYQRRQAMHKLREFLDQTLHS